MNATSPLPPPAEVTTQKNTSGAFGGFSMSSPIGEQNEEKKGFGTFSIGQAQTNTI